MSSRLFQEIREKRGLAYSIYSFNQTYADGGLFGIYAGTGHKEAAETVDVIAAEYDTLGDGDRQRARHRHQRDQWHGTDQQTWNTA